MSSQFAQIKQLPLNLALDKRATLESFYPGGNETVPEQIRLIGTRPVWLYLWGVTGSGKSHLLHAACHRASANGARACLLPLAQHTDMASALLDNLEALDLVCLDDIQAIVGDNDWETALFHLLNRLREQGASVIIAARERPANLSFSLPDLRSRLGWGTLVKIQPLDDEDKIQALQMRTRLRGFDLPRESALYLMRRVARDTKTLMQLLDNLDAASLQAQRKLTIPFLREVLARSDL